MRYIRLGPYDSRIEEDHVIAEVQAKRISARRFVELGKNIQALHRDGIAVQRAKWIATGEMAVFVHTGRAENEEPTAQGGERIFFAIEFGPGGVSTLLKIAGGYFGDPGDFNNHVTDALDRFRRGIRYP